MDLLFTGVVAVKSPVSAKPFIPVPPLHNFVPPPDLIVDSLGKSNRRSASTVAELKTWASSYFSAFLRQEGVEDLFITWDKISQFVEDSGCRASEDEALKLRSLIQASSTVMSCVEVTNVVDGNLNNEQDDCFTWIKTVNTRLTDVLQTQ